MKTEQQGITLIKHFEGCKLEAYICPAGIPTIAYGHIEGIKMGMKITQEQADEFLKKDLEQFENFINKRLDKKKISLLQYQFDAVIALVFNIGIGAFEKSTVWQKITNNGSINEIGIWWLKWIYAGGKILAGLEKRRRTEFNLYKTGNLIFE